MTRVKYSPYPEYRYKSHFEYNMKKYLIGIESYNMGQVIGCCYVPSKFRGIHEYGIRDKKGFDILGRAEVIDPEMLEYLGWNLEPLDIQEFDVY